MAENKRSVLRALPVYDNDKHYFMDRRRFKWVPTTCFYRPEAILMSTHNMFYWAEVIPMSAHKMFYWAEEILMSIHNTFLWTRGDSNEYPRFYGPMAILMSSHNMFYGPKAILMSTHIFMDPRQSNEYPQHYFMKKCGKLSQNVTKYPRYLFLWPESKFIIMRKPVFGGMRPGKTQTGLLSYRD